MTVEQLSEGFIQFKKCDVKEITIVKIKGIIERYIFPKFKNCLINKINILMLQDWKAFMNEKKLSLSTKISAFITFKSMFAYAEIVGHIKKTPFKKYLKNFIDNSIIPKKMEFYTWQEFKIFIGNAENEARKNELCFNDLSEWNYYVFFNIAFFTGLRKGEIYALKWSDIDLDKGILSVTRTLTQRLKGGDRETAPKSKASIRRLIMPLPLIKILKAQLNRQQIQHNFTNDFRICGGIRSSTLQRRNELYSKNLKNIRIHDFRHSHASLLASQGINIQEIARRLGHKRVEMTWNTYCHLYPEEESRTINVLNNLQFA